MDIEEMVIHWGRHSKTAVLTRQEITLESFYRNFIVNPVQATKGDYYITTASEVEITKATKSIHDGKNKDHYRRNNKTHKASWCVAIDGDRRTDRKTYCITPQRVTAALTKANINHIIYTSPSHKHKHPKWRLLVFCHIEGEDIAEKHHATVKYLYKLLRSSGCSKLMEERSSYTLSQMWFLPIATTEYYCSMYTKGNDLVAQDPVCITEENVSKPAVRDGQTYREIIDIIVNGKSPLHDTIGKYIWGAIRDGRNVTEIIETLNGLTVNYNGNSGRLKARKTDIPRRVEAAKKKYLEEVQWTPVERDDNMRIYTKYPDQGGNFERLVQLNMKRMIYPNRPIAVTAARFQISVLGGRIYTGTTGKGLVQTILLTGRSTIGKSFVKKNSIWLFDNIYKNEYSHEFMGAAYYTSVKNFVNDAKDKYSLGSIRTESGQSDKSLAGDMTRVRMYELEAATESGETGHISAGAQNDAVPPIYSPSITVVRESVAEIQREADELLRTSIAGIEGRRSYVVADPEKEKVNNDPVEEIPAEDKVWLRKLIALTIDEKRKKWDEPLKSELWIRWEFENPMYLKEKQTFWLEKEKESYKQRDIYTTTIFGRMIEKVPAYAALLAVCENPQKPIITNEQIDIAEASMIAEMEARQIQHESGDLSGPWGALEKRVRAIFETDMTQWKKRYDKQHQGAALKELKKGCISWAAMQRIIQHTDEFKQLKAKDNFFHIFDKQVESWGIVRMPQHETKTQFNHCRMTYRRV